MAHFICFILLIKSGHNADHTQRMENKLHIMKSYSESQCKGCEYKERIDLGNFYNQSTAPIVLKTSHKSKIKVLPGLHSHLEN